MSTKQRVLETLSIEKGNYISGQEMADKLFVTRAAIWKAIKALEKDGYDIEAVNNKGYRLRVAENPIDTDYMEKTLKAQGINVKAYHYDTVTSTNDKAKELADTNDSNVLVVADLQTQGRGRRGRSFFSPKGTGLYMSYLLWYNEENNLATITAVCASAVAKAIDEVAFNGEDITTIKWVNDIYLGTKKISGILTEGFAGVKGAGERYIIIGIGVNLFAPTGGFPRDIKDKAGAISEHELSDMGNDVKTMLITSIIRNLHEYYYKDRDNKALSIYRDKSMLLGHFVKINSFGDNPLDDRYAQVTGITDEYHLKVRYDNGIERELDSGEISVVKY